MTKHEALLLIHGYTDYGGSVVFEGLATALSAKSESAAGEPVAEYTRGWQDCLSMHIAPTAASTEEAAGEPYAYELHLPNDEYSLVYATYLAKYATAEERDCDRLALYTAPPAASGQRLTDEQRGAVEYAIAMVKSGSGWNSGHVDTLRALLRASDSDKEG